MNDIIKRNLFALFALALLSILQGCSHSPTTQSVAGNYIDEINGDKLKLNPDGTGTKIGKNSWGESHYNLKYSVIDDKEDNKEDNTKLVIDYYLSELDWKAYQNSYIYQAQLQSGKSPDQIKAEAMANKAGHSTFYKKGDNKLCQSSELCFVKQK